MRLLGWLPTRTTGPVLGDVLGAHDLDGAEEHPGDEGEEGHQDVVEQRAHGPDFATIWSRACACSSSTAWAARGRPCCCCPAGWPGRATCRRRFGYLVPRHALDEIATRFVAHVVHGRAAAEPYAIVGHSLGNVITRLASPRLPAGFSRFAMLAPPNQPAPARPRLQRNPVFRDAHPGRRPAPARRRLLRSPAGARGADADLRRRRAGPGRAGCPSPGRPATAWWASRRRGCPACPIGWCPCLHTFIMNDSVVDPLDLVRVPGRGRTAGSEALPG